MSISHSRRNVLTLRPMSTFLLTWYGTILCWDSESGSIIHCKIDAISDLVVPVAVEASVRDRTLMRTGALLK
jgi:hypothetical protein